MKILIGYDGSDCAAGAMLDLRHAGLPADTEALIVAVADVYPHLPASSFEPVTPEAFKQESLAVRRARLLAEQAMADARRLSEEGAAKLHGLFPTWKVLPEACADAPYWAFIKRASEWGADLIVVGSHGRSALGRAVMGSVSLHVLHNATCSVRIGRCSNVDEAARERPVRIVLGVDGSPDSATAAAAVAARQWPAGSEVRVIGVLDLRISTVIPGLAPSVGGSPDPTWPVEVGDDGPEQLGKALRAVAAEIERPGLTVTTHVLQGDPKRVLVDEAHAGKADCIFLGAKGHGRIERIVIGSVSATIAARAHCSVEVVRSS